MSQPNHPTITPMTPYRREDVEALMQEAAAVIIAASLLSDPASDSAGLDVAVDAIVQAADRAEAVIERLCEQAARPLHLIHVAGNDPDIRADLAQGRDRTVIFQYQDDSADLREQLDAVLASRQRMLACLRAKGEQEFLANVRVLREWLAEANSAQARDQMILAELAYQMNVTAQTDILPAVQRMQERVRELERASASYELAFDATGRN